MPTTPHSDDIGRFMFPLEICEYNGGAEACNNSSKSLKLLYCVYAYTLVAII